MSKTKIKGSGTVSFISPCKVGRCFGIPLSGMVFFALLLTLTLAAESSYAQGADNSQLQTQPVAEDNNVSDHERLPYNEMTPDQQEVHRQRVKKEVGASAIILGVFIFFVFIISVFRFTRNYRNYLKLSREKKFGYKDIWGNPRVQQDDLPTDAEIQSEDYLL